MIFDRVIITYKYHAAISKIFYPTIFYELSCEYLKNNLFFTFIYWPVMYFDCKDNTIICYWYSNQFSSLQRYTILNILTESILICLNNFTDWFKLCQRKLWFLNNLMSSGFFGKTFSHWWLYTCHDFHEHLQKGVGRK